MRDARFQWPLSSFLQAAAVPSHFLPLYYTRSKMRSQFATCYSPGHLLAPSSTFTGQKGCRAAEGSDCLFEAVGRQREGSIAVWMLAPLPPGSSQPGGFSSAMSVLGPALSCSAPHTVGGVSREREQQRQKGAERIETRR